MPTFRILLAALVCAVTAPAYAIDHQWSNASKEAVGTTYGTSASPVWFTVGQGILNEIYYPRIDRAQVGDSQLLFMVGGEFLEEKRDFSHTIRHPMSPPSPRPIIESAHGDIRFTKEVVTDALVPAVRVHYSFDAPLPAGTSLYILHKPTADNDGAHDAGRTLTRRAGETAFLAWDEESGEKAYQAVIASVPVAHASVGLVGESDGWQDLSRNHRMTQFLPENRGNLAYTAELKPAQELDVVIGFGATPDEALGAAIADLKKDYASVRASFDRGWAIYAKHLAQAPWLAKLPSDVRENLLWDTIVIKAHEDKLNRGAIVASLSIPNLPAGTGAPDGKNTGGYHLVWPRDLFKSGLALLRMGDKYTALDVLRFMSRIEHDGRMSQNAWVDGRPFWGGEQMDEEAFPLLLAYELKKAGMKLDAELEPFLARRLARLQQSSGRTGQERWEEAGGFSPNTMGVMAAALSRSGDEAGASRLLSRLLETTVSRHGPLSNQPYFVRISTEGNPDSGAYLQIANGGPALQEYRVLDGGFLEWVRWFPQAGGELGSIIRNTLSIYDDAANGVAVYPDGMPLYHRYTADAYGVGRLGGPWPILTLERALPELEAGNTKAAIKLMSYVRSLYGPGDMCPEQLDENQKPMPFGASPLVWCHAEMVELGYKISQTLR